MSEIYKRSLGMTYDERALEHEMANGTAGYDLMPTEAITDDLSIETRVLSRVDRLRTELMEWHMYEAINGGLNDSDRAEVVLLETEIVFRDYEDKMTELAIEHPRYTGHVGKLLTDRLDALAAFGHPVDPEMYIEAQALADEIVAASPDKNAQELTEIVTTMVEMIQAEYKMRHLAVAA